MRSDRPSPRPWTRALLTVSLLVAAACAQEDPDPSPAEAITLTAVDNFDEIPGPGGPTDPGPRTPFFRCRKNEGMHLRFTAPPREGWWRVEAVLRTEEGTIRLTCAPEVASLTADATRTCGLTDLEGALQGCEGRDGQMLTAEVSFCEAQGPDGPCRSDGEVLRGEHEVMLSWESDPRYAACKSMVLGDDPPPAGCDEVQALYRSYEGAARCFREADLPWGEHLVWAHYSNKWATYTDCAGRSPYGHRELGAQLVASLPATAVKRRFMAFQKAFYLAWSSQDFDLAHTWLTAAEELATRRREEGQWPSGLHARTEWAMRFQQPEDGRRAARACMEAARAVGDEELVSYCATVEANALAAQGRRALGIRHLVSRIEERLDSASSGDQGDATYDERMALFTSLGWQLLQSPDLPMEDVMELLVALAPIRRSATPETTRCLTAAGDALAADGGASAPPSPTLARLSAAKAVLFLSEDLAEKALDSAKLIHPVLNQGWVALAALEDGFAGPLCGEPARDRALAAWYGARGLLGAQTPAAVQAEVLLLGTRLALLGLVPREEASLLARTSSPPQCDPFGPDMEHCPLFEGLTDLLPWFRRFDRDALRARLMADRDRSDAGQAKALAAARTAAADQRLDGVRSSRADRPVSVTARRALDDVLSLPAGPDAARDLLELWGRVVWPEPAGSWSPDALSRHLPDDAAVLVLVTRPAEASAVLITADGITLHAIPRSRAALRDALERARDALGANRDMDPADRATLSALLAPLPSGISRLVVELDPLLRGLPANLLESHGAPVLGRIAVSYTRSLPELGDALSRPAPGPPRDALLVGDSRPDTAPLDHARAVVTRIAEGGLLHPTARLLGADATMHAVTEGVRDADLVLFSVHGVWDPADPALQHLLLAGQERLDAMQLRGLALRREAVVVLASCGSATGDGWGGLMDAGLDAGAGAVVASNLDLVDGPIHDAERPTAGAGALPMTCTAVPGESSDPIEWQVDLVARTVAEGAGARALACALARLPEGPDRRRLAASLEWWGDPGWRAVDEAPEFRDLLGQH